MKRRIYEASTFMSDLKATIRTECGNKYTRLHFNFNDASRIHITYFVVVFNGCELRVSVKVTCKGKF